MYRSAKGKEIPGTVVTGSHISLGDGMNNSSG